MKYIIANWKANKTFAEAQKWVQEFIHFDFYNAQDKIEIIICPPFPFIPYLRSALSIHPFIKIGSQDISKESEGTHTGETVGKNLSGLIDYCIIGHSERRKQFGESEKVLFDKFDQAKKYAIEPIYCLQSQNDKYPQDCKIVVYEPGFAISSGSGIGNNISPLMVEDFFNKLQTPRNVSHIYGGSVNENDAKDYLIKDSVQGILIGGASLDVKRFYAIIKLAI